MSAWDDQDISNLKQWHLNGYPPSVIVRNFRGKFTRKAIVGKIRRLQLPKRKKGLHMKSTRRRGILARWPSDFGNMGLSIVDPQLGTPGFDYHCRRVLVDENYETIKGGDGLAQFCGAKTDEGEVYCPKCLARINTFVENASANRLAA